LVVSLSLKVSSNLTVLINRIDAMETRMSAQLDALVEQVHANTSRTQSLITLVNGLADRIVELKTDPAALQSLADEIRTTNDAIVASVEANTPLAGTSDDGTPTEPPVEPNPEQPVEPEPEPPNPDAPVEVPVEAPTDTEETVG
jgi:outer membrane biosynthesis protein TonB